MLHRMRRRAAGFTLIELLIVIGIIVILSVVVVLTLNPAQLLAQSRDSRRVSDLAALQSAISLYLADVSSPSVGSSTGSGRCYVHASASIPSTGGCSGRFTGGMTATTSTLLSVNGAGWMPIDFTQISSGAPISGLPQDPVNNSTYFMAYANTTGSTLTYEISVDLESTKYTSGSGNLENSDGGSSATLYEAGTAAGLNL